MAVSSANTARVQHRSTGVLHLEGGWDDSVDASDAAQVSRFRRRVQRAPAFRKALAACASVADTCVKQNNAIDIYERYWDDRGATSIDELHDVFYPPPSMHVQAVLRFVSTGLWQLQVAHSRCAGIQAPQRVRRCH